MAIVLIAGCQQKWVSDPEKTLESQGEAYSGAVVFEIQPVSDSSIPPGGQWWLGTYESQGQMAKFRIELDRPSTSSDVLVGHGRFVREPASRPSVFLGRLEKALEAKHLPKVIQRTDSLPFEFVVLGEHDSLAKDGGLFDDPPGDWTVIKIFLSDGEGEVFMNLAPSLGKGEFSIKDPEDGDIVVGQLARVL